MKSSNLLYRTEIDGLRAVAILSVVIFHFFPQLLSNGYLGVDIFFVISGFLISNQLLNDKDPTIRAKLKSFYKRRIKRLFPALFVFLTLTYVFVSLFFLSVDVKSFENSLIASYTFLANFYFWRDGGYFGGNDQLKPLLHIWSLSVEEQFYIFFPLFLLTCISLSRKLKYSVVVIVVLITTLSFILWLHLNYIGGANPAFFLLPARVWQFGLGALLGLISTNYPLWLIPSSASRVFVIISLALIFLGITLRIGAEFQTIMVSIGTVGFIAFSQYQNTELLTVFRSNISVFFGKISYSLYLYHWPIAVALTYYFVDVIIPVYVSLAGIMLSVFLGLVSYKWVENTFRKKLDFKATLVLLAVCLGLSGGVFLTKSNKDTDRLANTFSSASGTNFRCKISSYIPYGSSRACLIEENGSPNKVVAVFGNSHAQMYAPLLSDISQNNFNILLVPLNGCLPTTFINVSQRCLEMAKDNLSVVLSDGNVRVVVVGTTWYSDSYVDSDGNEIDKSKLKDAITILLNDIKKGGKYPVLFSPIPIPNKNYASVLARKLRFGKISEQEVFDIIKIPRSVFDENFSTINSHFEQFLGNSYVKVYDELCDQVNCYYGTKDLFYFADSNHLSQYSFTVFDKTKEQLRSILSSIE